MPDASAGLLGYQCCQEPSAHESPGPAWSFWCDPRRVGDQILTAEDPVAAVERITRGNFRLLERHFPRISRVLKINQLETITDDVVEAAASILVIGT